VDEFTVAIDVLLLDQTPPVVVLANVMVEAIQTEVGPVIAATTGEGLTVKDFVIE
jgi:hypothetical protein